MSRKAVTGSVLHDVVGIAVISLLEYRMISNNVLEYFLYVMDISGVFALQYIQHAISSQIASLDSGLALLLGLVLLLIVVYFMDDQPEEDLLHIESNRSLHSESFRGTISTIRYFLEHHHDVNEYHEQVGMTPLHLAAVNGQEHACAYLLANGANPTLLAEAAICHPYLLEFIQDNLELSFQECEQASALRLAILFRHRSCVELLLRHSNDLTDAELEICINVSQNKEDIEPFLLNNVMERLKVKYFHLTFQDVKACYNPTLAKTRILVAHNDQIYHEIKDRIFGIDILIKNPNVVDEHSITIETNEENQQIIPQDILSLMEEAIEKNGNQLFLNHSNLNIISISAIRLRKTGKHDRHPCVVFYCSTKNAIPLNEEPFPSVLKVRKKSVRTDVREGYFSLCHGGITAREWNNPLRSGSCIGIKGDLQTEASMGPFVQLRDGSTGFLTCAHLFSSIYKNCKPHIVQPADTIFMSGDISDSDKTCGTLVKQVFDPGKDVSIDAAVVKIVSREPKKGLFAIGSVLELREAGFDPTEIPVFDSGSVMTSVSPNNAHRPVIKFGSTTGLTRGAFRMNGSQVRVKQKVDLSTPITMNTFTMKGQYEIQTVGPKDFFQPGDSGSGVYIVDENKQLHCIGIAIGCTSYRSAIVTPIKEVLEALDLPKKLKTFTPEPMQH